MKLKIITLLMITTVLTINAFGATRAQCIQSQKPLYIANEKIKTLFNYVLIEYKDVCEKYNINNLEACSINPDSINKLITDTNKLNYLIDVTYNQAVINYQQCKMTGEYSKINNIRNIEFYILKDKIDTCYKTIKKSRENNCPL